MAFELTIAVKRDPFGSSDDSETAGVSASYTSVVLNGVLDDRASEAVLSTIRDLALQHAWSILVRMEDVREEDAACLERFAQNVMSLRSAGTHVQVSVLCARLHEKMARLTDARDWLIGNDDPSGPRHAVHVDGP